VPANKILNPELFRKLSFSRGLLFFSLYRNILTDPKYKIGEPFLSFKNHAFQAIIQQRIADYDGHGTDFSKSDRRIHPVAVRIGLKYKIFLYPERNLGRTVYDHIGMPTPLLVVIEPICLPELSAISTWLYIIFE
jgi:hypothetical protein